MVVTKLYLVVGIKNYPAYTGDSIEETVKVLVPANDEKSAVDTLKLKHPEWVDEVKSIKELYFIQDGCSFDEYRRRWDLCTGISDNEIFNLNNM